jgi:hypothetical protein
MPLRGARRVIFLPYKFCMQHNGDNEHGEAQREGHDGRAGKPREPERVLAAAQRGGRATDPKPRPIRAK